jgi:multidrug efflux pump subunit AcrB
MTKKITRPAQKAARTSEEISWPFGMKNYLIFAAALVVIVIGYITLGNGSMTLAPALLVLGYCVLIPVAIMIKDKPDVSSDTDGSDLSTE